LSCMSSLQRIQEIWGVWLCEQCSEGALRRESSNIQGHVREKPWRGRFAEDDKGDERAADEGEPSSSSRRPSPSHPAAESPSPDSTPSLGENSSFVIGDVEYGVTIICDGNREAVLLEEPGATGGAAAADVGDECWATWSKIFIIRRMSALSSSIVFSIEAMKHFFRSRVILACMRLRSRLFARTKDNEM